MKIKDMSRIFWKGTQYGGDEAAFFLKKL